MKNNTDLDIYKRTFDFAIKIVKLCKDLDGKPGVTRNLANQLFRSGTSVGANLREAKGAQSRADFVSKCSIACKEGHETLYWLELLIETGIMGKTEVEGLAKECNEIVAILTTIIKRTKQNAKKKFLDFYFISRINFLKNSKFFLLFLYQFQIHNSAFSILFHSPFITKITICNFK